MRFEKKAVTINGRKAFYWQKNHEQEKVVVLLHGFPGNHEGLVEMADGLGDCRLIIPDLPACGQSEPLKEKHSLENYAEWLSSFVRCLSVKQAIIIGHSFGSRVALVFSARYPETVKQLVLITPVAKVEGLIARAASLEYKIAEILPQHLRKAWLSNKIYQGVVYKIIFKSASPKRRQALIAKDEREMEHLNPQVHIELFDEFYKSNLIPLGKKIKAESLIIACDKDEVAPLNSVRELAGQLTRAKFEIMKNCGHIVVMEKPLTTARIIRRWLEQPLG